MSKTITIGSGDADRRPCQGHDPTRRRRQRGRHPGQRRRAARIREVLHRAAGGGTAPHRHQHLRGVPLVAPPGLGQGQRRGVRRRRLRPAGEKLRELCNADRLHARSTSCTSSSWPGADFVMGPDADYAVRNVFGIAGANPEIGKQVVRNRHLRRRDAQHRLRQVHPPGDRRARRLQQAAHRGGARAGCSRHGRRGARVRQVRPCAFAKENIFPKYLDVDQDRSASSDRVPRHGHRDGTLNLYDGKLRLMKPDGTYTDFACDKYTDYIGEKVLPWSYLKFPYAKIVGRRLRMDLDGPEGHLPDEHPRAHERCDKMATPLAQTEFEEFRQGVRPAGAADPAVQLRPADRAAVQRRDLAVQLLNDPEITSKETRVPVKPRAGAGHRLRRGAPGHAHPRLRDRRPGAWSRT